MIKITKNNEPLNEFLSIYNCIEFLQTELTKTDVPKMSYETDLGLSFEMDGFQFKVETETDKQKKVLLKWVEGFLYERPT